MSKKIPWEKIAVEYQTGNIGLRALGVRYKVSYAAIAKRSREGAWVKLKNQHKTKTISRAADLQSDMQAVDLATFNTNAESIADEAIAYARRSIDNAKKHNCLKAKGILENVCLALRAVELKHKAAGIKPGDAIPEKPRQDFKGDIFDKLLETPDGMKLLGKALSSTREKGN